MTREISYEVNALQVRYYYYYILPRSALTPPEFIRYSWSSNIFERWLPDKAPPRNHSQRVLVSHRTHGGPSRISISVMVEYIPVGKIKSVPGDATAYRLVPYPNVVNIIRWKDNTPEDVKWAQMSPHKVMGIISDGNMELSKGPKVDRYGNYGEYSGQRVELN